MVGDTFEFLIQLVLEYRNGSAPTAHVHDNDVDVRACLVLLIPARLAQSKSTR